MFGHASFKLIYVYAYIASSSTERKVAPTFPSTPATTTVLVDGYRHRGEVRVVPRYSAARGTACVSRCISTGLSSEFHERCSEILPVDLLLLYVVSWSAFMERAISASVICMYVSCDMCVYVCMYIYLYVCTYVHTYARVCISDAPDVGAWNWKERGSFWHEIMK